MRLTILIILGALFCRTSTKVAFAERLESDSYVIQFGNFNISSGERTSSSYDLTDTVGQTGAGPYGEYGSSTYFVGGGFQYIYQVDDFVFSLSKVQINLGTLTPNSHSTDSHTISITTRGGAGYSVYAYELHELRHSGNDTTTISDTTCDSGSCTISTAGVWQTQTIPGFGYNMSGDDIPATFTNSTYFRPFADRSQSEAMQIVMSSEDIAHTRTATVTYRAGISGSKEAGNYETGVAFVAVPGY